MESSLTMLFAALIGFGHAFEADHLVAVSNIVTKRDKLKLAIKDGIFWGIGHSSTIFLVGILIIVFNATFLTGFFKYFEALVGIMLVFIGIHRLRHHYDNVHHSSQSTDTKSKHHLAYGIGLVHGLAGSGAIVLLVLAEIQETYNSLIYLAIFGFGSVIGMLVVASIFSLPFTRKITSNKSLQNIMTFMSSTICVVYGFYIFIDNIV